MMNIQTSLFTVYSDQLQIIVNQWKEDLRETHKEIFYPWQNQVRRNSIVRRDWSSSMQALNVLKYILTFIIILSHITSSSSYLSLSTFSILSLIKGWSINFMHSIGRTVLLRSFIKKHRDALTTGKYEFSVESSLSFPELKFLSNNTYKTKCLL